MVYRAQQIITLLLLIILSASCISTNGGHKQQLIERKITAKLRSGDLAFRRGRGVVSDAVITVNRCGHYSHVGIVVERADGWYVVHEVPYEGVDERVYSQPIAEFFEYDKAKIGAIYRVGIDSTSQCRVVAYLDQKLEEEVPFDHDYDLDDTTHLYCTELVWRAYSSIGIDLTEGRRTEITLPGFGGAKILPTDIEANEDLELIYRFE